MPRRNPFLLLTSLALLGATSGSARQVPSAIFSDSAPDKEFPAAVEAPDVTSHGARLNAVYVASGRWPTAAVLLVQGFPSNEKNLDLAYSLRRAGWNVLIFCSRGSWGSAGTVSFSNAIETDHSYSDLPRRPSSSCPAMAGNRDYTRC
jgi:hypothetical protein